MVNITQKKHTPVLGGLHHLVCLCLCAALVACCDCDLEKEDISLKMQQ